MALGTKVGVASGGIVLYGDPAPPSERGTAPNFWPMSIVDNRSPLQLLLSIYDNCTTQGRRSIYFTMGRPFALKTVP